MNNLQKTFTVGDIVTAVVPAIRESLNPEFTNIKDQLLSTVRSRLDEFESHFQDSITADLSSLRDEMRSLMNLKESQICKKIDDSFNELAAITNHEFRSMQREMNTSKWAVQMKD